jgi:phosphatidylethanolamine/phosphatidyl-N-methylethanolamine N-methyltransferase
VHRGVEGVYRQLAPIYNLIFGAILEPGRRQAMARLAPAPGESILEIGVGTGLSALRYPPGCRVVAIDLSAPMIERARKSLARRGIDRVKLCRMDAGNLGFRDGLFDAIYAAYVINVVPDPLRVAREMLRVCRPTGRFVLLNHFSEANGGRRHLDSWLGRIASRAAVNWHVDLNTFLDEAGLAAVSVERVNRPKVSSLIVCHRR